jgi:hypothetical protein
MPNTSSDWKFQIEWIKRADDAWFELDEVTPSIALGWGVYVIWVPSVIPVRPGRVLKVGSGRIALQLAYERVDRLLYVGGRPPLVTWAEVEARHHHGVVKYLAQHLTPALFDDPLPENAPIPVNLPISV